VPVLVVYVVFDIKPAVAEELKADRSRPEFALNQTQRAIQHGQEQSAFAHFAGEREIGTGSS
jgi:hypothetical protein